MDLTATHRLGTRAFLLFLYRHVKWAALALIIAAAGWFWHLGLQAPYFTPVDYVLKAILILAGALFLLRILRAFFEYKGYAYRFDREFFHLTRGYITRQEIGVVYHQIQTVVIRRGVMDRMVGVSHLIIVLNNSSQNQPAEVVLPALEHAIAETVQKELLRQARIHAPRPFAAEEETPV